MTVLALTGNTTTYWGIINVYKYSYCYAYSSCRRITQVHCTTAYYRTTSINTYVVLQTLIGVSTTYVVILIRTSSTPVPAVVPLDLYPFFPDRAHDLSERNEVFAHCPHIIGIGDVTSHFSTPRLFLHDTVK